jgi:hypothetical protein
MDPKHWYTLVNKILNKISISLHLFCPVKVGQKSAERIHFQGEVVASFLLVLLVLVRPGPVVLRHLLASLLLHQNGRLVWVRRHHRT